MPIKTFRFMIVLFVTVFVFGRMCIAGTWIDDFSDRNLPDWGPPRGPQHFGGGRINDGVNAGVVDGHFHYEGKKQRTSHHLKNWGLGKIQDFSLELKFMFRNIRDRLESSWTIRYASFNEEKGDFDGFMSFLWYPDPEGKPNVSFITIDRYELRVPEDFPEFGQGWMANLAAIDRFAYEEKVWYTLRIAREGNQYTFSMGDVTLFAEDDSVPMGTIELSFHGWFTIWLDDFTVAGPDVPNGGPGFLGVNPSVERVTTIWGKLKAQN